MTIATNKRSIPLKEKDPDAQLIYGFEWATYFPPPLQLTASTWIVPAPLTKDSEAFTVSGSTRVRIGGGVIGETYLITNRVTTNGSPTETEDLSFNLKIKVT